MATARVTVDLSDVAGLRDLAEIGAAVISHRLAELAAMRGPDGGAPTDLQLGRQLNDPELLALRRRRDDLVRAYVNTRPPSTGGG